MRFLEPIEIRLQKIQPLHVGDDRGLCRFVGGFEIGRGESAAQAVVGDHPIHPGEALEVVPIELARLGRAQRRQNAPRVPAEDRAVRHVGQACDGERSGPHGVREIVVRRRL